MSFRKRVLTVLLTAAVVMASFGGVSLSFADGQTQTITAGQTITAESLNGTADTSWQMAVASGSDGFKVEIPEDGTLQLSIGPTEQSSGPDILLYPLSSKTSPVPRSSQDYKDGVKTNYYPVKKGTYNVSFVDTAGKTVTLTAKYAPANVTLESGKTYYAGKNAANGVSRFSFSAEKAGYLKVTAYPVVQYAPKDYDLTLLNAGNKPLTGEEHVSTPTKCQTYYGVRKGTYSIKLVTASTEGLYRIKAQLVTVKTSRKGSKRSNAAALTKGRKVKGLIYAGSKSSDWYKVTLRKAAKLKLRMSTKTNGGGKYGGIQVFVYRGRKRWSSTTFGPLVKTRTLVPYLDSYSRSTSNNTLSRGTYYIRVRSRSKGSGYYELTWK
jgi:hypothetical protein